MQVRGLSRCLSALWLLVLASATVHGSQVKDAGGVFTIDVPEAWQVQQYPGHLEARTPEQTTGLVLEALFKPPLSTADFAGYMVASWKETIPGWTQKAYDARTVGSRKALHIQATGRPGGIPLVGDYLFVATEEHMIVLTLYCPEAAYPQLKGTFDAILGSLALAPPRAQTMMPSPEPQVIPPGDPQTARPLAIPEPGGLKRLSYKTGVFSLVVPSDWHEVIYASEFHLLSPDRAARLSVDAQMKVVPIDKLIESLVLHWSQATPGWTRTAQGVVQLAGRPAVHIVAQHSALNTPTVAEYFFAPTDVHNVVLTWEVQKEAYQRYRPVFAQILASFRFGIVDPQAAPQPFQLPAGMRRADAQGGACSVAVPADWRLQQQGSGIAGSDATGRAQLQITVQPRRATSLQAFAEQFIAACRSQTTDWVLTEQEALAVGGRQAMHLRATGIPFGQTFTGDYVLIVTDRHQAVLVLSCPTGESQQRQFVFEQIIASLRVQ